MQNKAQVAGILTIVSGVLGIIGALIFICMIVFFRYFMTSQSGIYDTESREVFGVMALVYGISGFFMLICSVVSIIGGIYALKRRLWGLALAGAICGIIIFMPLGIVATVFVSQGQNEFSLPDNNTGRISTTPEQ